VDGAPSPVQIEYLYHFTLEAHREEPPPLPIAPCSPAATPRRASWRSGSTRERLSSLAERCFCRACRTWIVSTASGGIRMPLVVHLSPGKRRDLCAKIYRLQLPGVSGSERKLEAFLAYRPGHHFPHGNGRCRFCWARKPATGRVAAGRELCASRKLLGSGSRWPRRRIMADTPGSVLALKPRTEFR
jgi:hypothetical protein